MDGPTLKDGHQEQSIAVLLILAVAPCIGFVVYDVLRQSNASQAASFPVSNQVPVALPSDPVNGGLIVDHRELDLGDVGETDSFEWELTLTNPTEAAIEIEGFQGLCSQQIWNQVTTVPPGERVVLQGTFNLTPRQGETLARLRPIGNRIVPIIGGRLQQGWRFMGRTHRVLAINPSFTNGIRREGALMVALLRPHVGIEVECDPANSDVDIEVERRQTIEGLPVYEVHALSSALNPPKSVRVQIRSTPFEGMRASVKADVRVDPRQ